MEKLSVNSIRKLIKRAEEIGYPKEVIMDITGLDDEEMKGGRIHGTKEEITGIKASLLSFIKKEE